MLIIRFARRGRSNAPFYDIVVAEKARAVKKKFINKLGYYNPLADSGAGELVYNKEDVLKYISNGAQMSQAVARLLTKDGLKEAGKFVVARASKPKKEPKEEPVEEPKAEEPAAESSDAEAMDDKEAAKEETPAEEPKEESKAEEPKAEEPALEAEAPAEEAKAE